jgi:hypothetical protein
VKQDSINILAAKFPERRETLDFIDKLRKASRELPFLEFFEPLAAMGISDGKATIAFLTPELLASWISHMSYGARSRMEALEDQILDGLAEGKLLVPAVLTRCHLEIAGFAAYTNRMVVRFAEKQDYEMLKADILHTAYSSAMVKDDGEAITGMRYPGVHAPPRNVMNGIKELQEFMDMVTEKGFLNLRALYAMLCDFGHPSILGMRGFARASRQNREGRFLQYFRNEELTLEDAENLLMALIWSMRGGHTNATLMYCGQIIVEKGGFRYERVGQSHLEEFSSTPTPVSGRPWRSYLTRFCYNTTE